MVQTAMPACLLTVPFQMPNPATLAKRTTSFASGFIRDPLTHWPFPSISRRAYGNLSGFRQNFYGSIHTRLHRLTGSSRRGLPCDPETAALAQQLRRDGLAKVSDWVDPETVARIRSSLLTAAESNGENPSEYITILEARSFPTLAPAVFEMFNPRIAGFLEAYFGGPFLVNSGAFRLTRHVPDAILQEGEVYSDRWHTDSGPTSMLAIFMLLNDLDAEGGPTSALPIHATREAVRQGYASRKENEAMRSRIESHPSRVEMTGPAGTIMFVNVARCLHRAGIPAPGKHREWLQFRLFPSRAPTDTTRLQPARILKYTNRIDQDY